MKPVLLDLFCGAGGAAVGYARAGFEVIGVDNQPQPRYPFEFHRCDALSFLDELIRVDIGFFRFDAIHASPPCQHWSAMSHCRPGLAATYPKLIEPARERLEAIGLPYVIENVPGAPLLDPLVLCGSSFGLRIRRHRLFETTFAAGQPPCDHRGYAMNRNNSAGRARMKAEFPGRSEHDIWKAEMGVTWMTNKQADESIPPVFTEYVGKHLKAHLQAKERMAA